MTIASQRSVVISPCHKYISPLIGARSDKSVIPFSIIKVLILRDLISGTKRFGERKKTIGSVSQKVLTAQLRDMEESGLVIREVYAEVPPSVEYSLTELGQSLKPILDAMQCWGEGYKASVHTKV